MTDAAEEFVFILEERIEQFDDMVSKETNGIKRAYFMAYRDASTKALQDFQSRREDMEKGTLVPEREEPYSSFSEKVAA